MLVPFGKGLGGGKGKGKGKRDIRFAVAAPWGIEFQQDVLVLVNDNVFIVVCHHDLNGTFLLFRDGLGFDAGLDLAVNEVLDESTNVLLGQFLALVEGEFLVLDGFLDGEGGPFVDFEVEVAGVGAEGFGVDGGEADLALVLLGDRLQFGGQLVALFRGFGEDVGKGDASLVIF